MVDIKVRCYWMTISIVITVLYASKSLKKKKKTKKIYKIGENFGVFLTAHKKFQIRFFLSTCKLIAFWSILWNSVLWSIAVKYENNALLKEHKKWRETERRRKLRDVQKVKREGEGEKERRREREWKGVNIREKRNQKVILGLIWPLFCCFLSN